MRLFAAEFDAIPLPNPVEARANMLVCNATNMEYIRSVLPCPVQFEYHDFFARMAKHNWRVAQVSSGAVRGANILGSHRPAGVADAAVPPRPKNFRPASNWDLIPTLKRVSAYAFRSDNRHVTAVRSAGGFYPPSTRTDDSYLATIAAKFVDYMKARFNKVVDPQEVVAYIRLQGPAGKIFTEYEKWRAILEGEMFHIGKMAQSEFLKGYVSTSRNISQTSIFSHSEEGQQSAIYAVHSEGGFLLPHDSTGHAHSGKGNEAEIAHPGPIPWSKVMAFRCRPSASDSHAVKAMIKVIFVRKGFAGLDPYGHSKVIAALGSLTAG